MRVAVFGAAGQLGRRVILRLIKERSCSVILAADRDARGLSDLHARFDAHGVVIRYLEADDPRSTRERMSGMDAVVSCLGGSGSGELSLARAAVGEGIIYLSSSDVSGLERVPGSAGGMRREGPGAAFTGLGWSPGLSNLLALHAAKGFERLDFLDIAWAIAASDLQSPGGQELLLHSFSGRCRSFEQGRLKEVRAGSWEDWRSFPPEVGWSNVTYSCQPEPLTLPAHLPGVLRVQVKGGLNLSAPPYVIHTIAWVSQYLPEHLQELVNHGMGLALKRLHRPGQGPSVSGLRVEAVGVRNGRREHLVYGVTGGYLDATAGMLVAALGLVGANGDRGRGVVALEEAFTLRDFLPALRREGVRFWGPANRNERPFPRDIMSQ